MSHQFFNNFAGQIIPNLWLATNTYVLEADLQSEGVHLLVRFLTFQKKQKLKLIDGDALNVPVYRELDFEDQVDEPLHEEFDRIAEEIQKTLEDSRKVIVCCDRAISRSPTLILAFLISKKGYSLFSAFELMSTCKLIMPNAGFMDQLCAYELKTRQTASVCTARYSDFINGQCSFHMLRIPPSE